MALLIIGAVVMISLWFFNYALIKGPAEQNQRDHWEQQAKTSPKNLQLICPPSEDGKPIPAEKCKRSGYYEYDRQQRLGAFVT